MSIFLHYNTAGYGQSCMKKWIFCFVFSKYLKNGRNVVKRPWRLALQKALMTEHRKNYISDFVRMSILYVSTLRGD